MLISTSNYRPGGKYLFVCEGKEVGFEVISLGYKCIELKRLDNGFVKKYNLSELSTVPKPHQQKFKKSFKKAVVVEAKPAAKITEPVVDKIVVPVKKSVEVAAKNPVVVDKKPKVITKTEPKINLDDDIMLSSVIDIDKLLKQSGDIKEDKYIVQTMRRDIRLMLKMHGYITSPEWKIPQLFGLINANLKDNPKK